MDSKPALSAPAACCHKIFRTPRLSFSNHYKYGRKGVLLHIILHKFAFFKNQNQILPAFDKSLSIFLQEARFSLAILSLWPNIMLKCITFFSALWASVFLGIIFLFMFPIASAGKNIPGMYSYITGNKTVKTCRVLCGTKFPFTE